MTNSGLGKRERLIEGACRVLHEHGVDDTTLADIAEVADVPVGNVYYYFKTKDELIEAAIDAHADTIQTALGDLERHRTPRARLKALALTAAERSEEVSRYGCPHGTLCQELAKRDGGHDRRAAKLLALSIDWAEEQFRLMGKRDARDLAVSLVAGIQGTSLLAGTFHDPEIMTRQAHRLARWIDELAEDQDP
jgi:TetR/AcrR family transcriptional repressor of nem operon